MIQDKLSCFMTFKAFEHRKHSTLSSVLYRWLDARLQYLHIPCLLTLRREFVYTQHLNSLFATVRVITMFSVNEFPFLRNMKTHLGGKFSTIGYCPAPVPLVNYVSFIWSTSACLLQFIIIYTHVKLLRKSALLLFNDKIYTISNKWSVFKCVYILFTMRVHYHSFHRRFDKFTVFQQLTNMVRFNNQSEASV